MTFIFLCWRLPFILRNNLFINCRPKQERRTMHCIMPYNSALRNGPAWTYTGPAYLVGWQTIHSVTAFFWMMRKTRNAIAWVLCSQECRMDGSYLSCQTV